LKIFDRYSFINIPSGSTRFRYSSKSLNFGYSFANWLFLSPCVWNFKDYSILENVWWQGLQKKFTLAQCGRPLHSIMSFSKKFHQSSNGGVLPYGLLKIFKVELFLILNIILIVKFSIIPVHNDVDVTCFPLEYVFIF
jgi:hypothetical protein